jgi:hypothetical protein
MMGLQVAGLAFGVLLIGTPLRAASATAQDQQPEEQALRTLVERIEQAFVRGDPSSYLQLLEPASDRERAESFVAREFRPSPTRAVLLERERLKHPDGGLYRLIFDAFVEEGDRARVSTWQVDLSSSSGDWRVADQAAVSGIDSLYRLSVNPTKQYTVRNFTVKAEDLALTLVQGSVFTVETDEGITGLVMLGRGEMEFRPTPPTEKGQIAIFAGRDVLETRFDGAYVRMGEISQHADLSGFETRTPDPRELRRAQEVFRQESAKSFSVDLGDLAPDPWSLLPAPGDILAEIRTRRFDTLTYARQNAEPEDISLFDRRRQKNIAVYASAEKLLDRGPFYDEDDYSTYDVLDYDIGLAFTPDRLWLDGRAILRLRTRAPVIGQLTLRLAESLVVRSVVSEQFGRLFALRARNQNSLLVNLPSFLMQDSDLTLTITYSGRLEPQPPDRETAALQRPTGQNPLPEDVFFLRGEPSYLYSSRSFWYPQGPFSDYATAKLKISVPGDVGVVASGEPLPGSPTIINAPQIQRAYQFEASQPIRYLSFLVSRFVRADSATVTFGDAADDLRPAHGIPVAPMPAVGSSGNSSIALTIEANPRQAQRGRELSARAREIIQFYRSILGDAPYSSFTVALIEHSLPGGHSPGYFAMLNQPLPYQSLTWRNDPVSFDGFPDFFLAHEIAHQWWGQAIGWRNYHEQWLSEGFAQYFALLYAEQYRPPQVLTGILRQLRRWSLAESDQGPVYLGYRLGHVRDNPRVFRALVYNKGAAVLHMLRRLIGDEAFFAGLRQFYLASCFKKAGTEDFRLAMEVASNRTLQRFFERWIYGASLPRISFAYRVEPGGAGALEARLRFEQTGEVFDLPLTASVVYADGRSVDVPVVVSERTVEVRIPLAGPVRSIDISDDDGSLAEVERGPAPP